METDYYENILNNLIREIDESLKLTKAKHTIKAIYKARLDAGRAKELVDRRK